MKMRWLSVYGVKIPVLVDLASKAELEWPFDEPQLLAFLQSLSKQG